MAKDGILTEVRHRAGGKPAPPRHKRLSSYHATTALAGGLLAALTSATSAAAQTTQGGQGGQGFETSAPPAGGTSSNTGSGQNGQQGDGYQGGAGGGAGATGGNGGQGNSSLLPPGGIVPGGLGGTTPGSAGANGGSANFASGGGGGAHGAVLVTLPTPATDVTGGSGGNGGNASDGDGGGGGAGGFGVVADIGGSLTFDHSIAGGAGGAGGSGFFYGGSGGDGGHGLLFTGGAIATINGAVTGGAGGTLGSVIEAGGVPGIVGLGGSGIVGSDLNLTLNAAVSGGLSGDGVTRGHALLFSAGTNSLTLGGGWGLNGGIQIGSGSLTFAQAGDAMIANVISGGGSINKAGGGVLTLTAANTYAGGTTITGGLINFSSGGNLGTGGITLDGGGLQWAAGNALDISSRLSAIGAGGGTFDTNGNNVILADDLSGAGGITKSGAGTLILTGANSYAGGTTVNAGLINFATGDNLGTGNITLDGGGLQWATGNTLDISSRLDAIGAGGGVFDINGDTVTFASALTGAGGITASGSGALILTGTNTYAGGTTIDPGTTLQIGDGGTTGTLGGGDIVNDGSLVFNRSDDIIVSSDIFGGGSLTKLGGGTLSLTGFNQYVGTTSVQAGTLAFGGAGLFGTSLIEIDNGAGIRALDLFNGIQGDISILAGGGTIDTGVNFVDHFGSVNFTGELTKTGSGTLLLNDGNGTTGGDGGINVLAGTLALGGDFAAGTGAIRLANGTTLANAACFCGLLALDNDIEIAAGGTATIDGQSNDTVLNGVLSGGNIRFVANAGQSSEGGGSVFYLNGANEYGDTTIGANVALVLLDGTLGVGDTAFDPTPSNPFTPATLVFANTADYTYGGMITGSGLISVETFDPATTITLAGSNSSGSNFTGTIEVSSGRLNINGDFGDIDNLSASLILNGCICTDATLGGSGTFYGNVDVITGTINPGNSPGTLTIAGNLTLGAGTILNYELGQSAAVGGANNDLIVVGGDLTLDGTLNTIAFGPDYGPGYYALFRYGGTLTDNTLDIGTIANGLSAELLFNIPGQINIRLGDQVFQYWDGPDTTGSAGTPTGPGDGNGGAGTWNASSTNWTAATGFNVNDSWRSTVGIFAGANGGTVTVEGTQSFQELRFETANYLLRPADGAARLNTTGGFSVVDVNAGVTADIGVVIEGAAGLTKTGAGALILSGANVYAGATDIIAGTLRMGTNFALSVNTAVTVAAGATFDLDNFDQSIGSLAGEGSVTIGSAQMAAGGNNSSTLFSGSISGNGFFAKNGTGILTLTGTSTIRTLSVQQGQVVLDATGSLSGTNVSILAPGSLTNSGTITTGGFGLDNSGLLTNIGTINGTVQTRAGSTSTNSGTINGNVQNSAGGTFISTGIVTGLFINSGSASIRGQLNGNVDNQSGSITLTGLLTGVTAFNQTAGATFNLAGFDATVGSLRGDGSVQLGAGRLTTGGDNSSRSFSGVISGSGGLTKVGTGGFTLQGINTYTGLTQVSAGTLTIATGASIAGVVQNDATFNNFGALADLLTNNGTALNAGTLNAGVINNGTLNSNSVINNGLENAGAAFLRGTINGFVTNNGGITLTGDLIGITNFTQTANGSLALDGNTILVGGLNGLGTIDVSGGSLDVGFGNANGQFDGVIFGEGNLRKNGTGTLILTGANTFTGSTTITGGTLALTGSLAGSVGNFANFQNDGTVAGLVTNLGGATAANSGTMSGGLDNDGTFSSTGIVSGGVVNTGTASFRGQLNGAVEGRAGIITMTGTTTGIGRVGQLAGALFDLNGFNTGFGSLSGEGEVRLGAAQLTVGSDNTDSTFAGIITGTGANGLAKIGTGTLTLTGANSYVGTTTISGGTLQVGAGGTSGTLGGGDILVDAALRFNRSDTVTIDDLITGSGLVANAGTGTLALTRSNSAGSDFTGRLHIQSGALVLNAAFGDTTGNTAQLTIDAGTSLSGTGTFRGSATVNGTLSPGNSPGTLTFGGNLTLGAAAILNFELGLSGTVAGANNDLVVVGGNLTIDGTLNVAAFGANYEPGYYRLLNYGGALIDNGVTAGSIAGGLSANVLTNIAGQVNVRLGPQVIQYWDGVDTTGAGTATNGQGGAGTWGAGTNWTAAAGFGINDSWRASTGVFGGLAGGGNVTVVGTQGFQELRFVADGYVLSGATAADGLATTAGFSLIDVKAAQATINAPISGAAGLSKTGAGVLILAGANSYAGGTVISGGTLQLGNGGASGSILGPIENNATLTVNRSNALALSGAISGTGALVQAGAGTTTLTGLSTYTGGTLVQAGRLRGDVLSLRGDIQNGATLEFAQATAGTFAGRLFGAGTVETTGAGLLTLATDNSNLTGDTRVLAGELRVTGLLSRSRVTVATGGTLSGTGTVGGIVAQSGGGVAPGSGGFGTLRVNGNMQFLAGSTFAAQVQPAGSDLLTGTGTAQLAGTIAVANAGGTYSFGAIYVLLQADGGRSGTFDAATGLNTFGAAFAPRIVYTATQVQLLLAQNQLLNILGNTPGTPNQISTLRRIDEAVAAGYNPQPLLALFNLTPQAALLNGADQLSGEIYATGTRAALDDERLVREATFTRLRHTQDLGFGQSFGAWGHAVGSWGSGDTDGNAARYERDQQGFVVGIDGGGTWDGGAWRLGLLGHHLTTDINVDARGSNADIERSGAGVYGGLDFGELRIRAGGTYSSLDLSGRRVATFTGFTETLSGETDGEALQGFAEIAYRFQVGASTHVEPYFQASLTHVEFDAFSETGGASRLRVEAEEDDLTTLMLGLRGSTLIPLGANTNLRLDGGLGGRFLSGDRMIFSLIALDASPNQAFDIQSAALDRFSVTGNLDATLELSRAVSLSVGYSGVVGANARDHAVRATVGLRF